MRKIIKIIAFVAIGFLVSFTPYFIIKQGNKMYVGESVVEKIVFKKTEADIAVFGSSVAWVHFNPQIIEKNVGLGCYNFGTNGTSHTQYQGLLKEYLQYSSGKIVVLAGSFAEFEPRDKIMEVYKYTDYLENTNIYNALYEIDSSLVWRLKNIPLYDIVTFDQYTYIRATKGLLDGSFRKDYNEYKGFSAAEKKWENVNNDSSILAKIDSNTIENYKKSINIINSRGKVAVLVLTPIYVEGQAKISNLEEIRKVYKSLAGSQNIFLDFTKSKICYEKKLFYNNTHLNAAGANIFSEEFSNEILNSIETFSL